MRWSFRIFRVGETEVRIHTTMVLLAAWYAWQGWQASGTVSAALGEVLFLALLFLSVLLHEFGHIFAARHYHIGTPQVLLTPIGGIASIARMPEKPGQEVVVALAGPAVTLAIVLILFGVMTLNGQEVYLLGGGSLIQSVATTNLFLLIFNLIPAFPMDGGRVLRALLSIKLGAVKGTLIAGRIGQLVALGFAWFGFQNNPILLMIAVFVFVGAQAEIKSVALREVMKSQPAVSVTVTNVPAILPDSRLAEALELFGATGGDILAVTDPVGHFVGMLARGRVVDAATLHGVEGGIDTAMTVPPPEEIVNAGMGIESTLERVLMSGRDALPVVDEEGRFLGMVMREHLTEVLVGLRAQGQLDTAEEG